MEIMLVILSCGRRPTLWSFDIDPLYSKTKHLDLWASDLSHCIIISNVLEPWISTKLSKKLSPIFNVASRPGSQAVDHPVNTTAFDPCPALPTSRNPLAQLPPLPIPRLWWMQMISVLIASPMCAVPSVALPRPKNGTEEKDTSTTTTILVKICRWSLAHLQLPTIRSDYENRSP